MRVLKAAAIIMAVMSLILVWIGAPQQMWRTWRISLNPATTSGYITKVDCPDHGFLSFSFPIGGVSYVGATPDFHGRCQDATVGQRVHIYFARSAPAIHYATFDDGRGVAPSDVLRGQLIAASILFCLVLPLIVILYIVIQRMRRSTLLRE